MESLIQKELDRFNDDLKEIIEFKRNAKNLTDDYFYQGKEEAYKEIISFLESIKNLPNELKGVSNNEQTNKFINCLLDDIHNINPELSNERTKEFYNLNL